MDDQVRTIYEALLIHRDHLVSFYEMEPNVFRLAFEYYAPSTLDRFLIDDDDWQEYQVTLSPRDE